MKTKQFETLGYDPRSSTDYETPVHCEKTTSTLPPTMGFNSHVIKPKTGVKKADIASQHLEPIKTGVAIPEQPNQNIMIILEIECLISQVNEKLHNIRPDTKGEVIYQVQAGHKSRALEEIDLFQKITLFELRKAFE